MNGFRENDLLRNSNDTAIVLIITILIITIGDAHATTLYAIGRRAFAMNTQNLLRFCGLGDLRGRFTSVMLRVAIRLGLESHWVCVMIVYI